MTNWWYRMQGSTKSRTRREAKMVNGGTYEFKVDDEKVESFKETLYWLRNLYSKRNVYFTELPFHGEDSGYSNTILAVVHDPYINLPKTINGFKILENRRYELKRGWLLGDVAAELSAKIADREGTRRPRRRGTILLNRFGKVDLDK